MKKTIFSLMAVVMFVGSSFNLNAATNLEIYKDCVAEAIEFQDELEEMGIDKQTANEVANIEYEFCVNGE
ncbi:hypothetical protein [Winogradskyella pacifica]|uniref:TMhelix containing protein n=1 Tax=Winogradskyella pacifica TaxID=664642 RepID=A0A3D9N4H4_9FLAO|nr:hypothetical protein [Winogradskyella pacifica]REE27807.1 hypothetical protein DFQ09_101646 [Winogradskyella pacifica]